MSEHRITFFPVGNGDTTLITLKDGTNILVDCNITKDSGDTEVIERYDVKSYLLDKLPKTDGVYHLDAFILTHPDIDHCRGVAEHFYLGDPTKYSQSDKNAERIIIDELWFAPRIFNEYKKDLNDEAKSIRKEADRRIKLYKDKETESSDKGNRIRAIGYSDNEILNGLDGVLSIPGSEVNLINGSLKNDFRFHILAPLKKDSDGKDSERNECSIVLLAKFDVKNIEEAGRVILGGDSCLYNWLNILKKNSLDNLSFDIFVAPHHCSWYFFSEEKYEENPEPNEKIVELISCGRPCSKVIASCKKIENNDDNPPNYYAAGLYQDAVGDENFYCTSVYPDEKEPKPLIFSMTENGPVKEEPGEISRKGIDMAIKRTIETPKRYG